MTTYSENNKNSASKVSAIYIQACKVTAVLNKIKKGEPTQI